jgi:hypothetical protein
MTREQSLAHVDEFAFLAISDATSLVNKIYDDLEKSKSCSGCIHHAFFTAMNGWICESYDVCTRDPLVKDLYIEREK